MKGKERERGGRTRPAHLLSEVDGIEELACVRSSKRQLSLVSLQGELDAP